MAEPPSRLLSVNESEGATPTLGDDIGSATVEALDFADASPEIKLQLRAKRLLFYVVTTVLFYAAFTVVAFIGVPVEIIYEPIGTSKKSEERIEIYNTYSGYVMAFIETLLGVYMSSFLPVLNVYVHNTLYLLQPVGAEGDPAIRQSTPARKFPRKSHSAMLFFLPIVIALTMGNSLRGFQAGQSSEGVKHIMTQDDLKQEQSMFELVKAAAMKKQGGVAPPENTRAVNTILRNAIRQRSAPFAFDTASPCGGETTQAETEKVQLDVHSLDSTSAVYGFVPQEWNGEAMANGLEPTSTFHITYKDAAAALIAGTPLALPADFSISTAFEIMIQGKLVIERAYGDATTASYPCSRSDGIDDSQRFTEATETGVRRTRTLKASTPPHLPKLLLKHMATRSRRLQLEESRAVPIVTDEEESEQDDSLSHWTQGKDGVFMCQGAVSSLPGMVDFTNAKYQTLENLVLATGVIIDKTVGNLSLEETEITFEKYDLTRQIHLEAVRVDIPILESMEYGLEKESFGSDSSERIYAFSDLAGSFCGSDGCAFVDVLDTMKMQREIGVVPYVVNCSLDVDHVQYSADLRGYYPTDCAKLNNTALLYGIGSYITGDEYGSNGARYGFDGPYIRGARRHLRFTFAKVTWQTDDLARMFNAECRTDKYADKADCHGLWYQLQPSGRFLFAGGDALPTETLAKADFRSSIPLVQLNSPSLYLPEHEATITMEPLNPSHFKTVKWDKTTPYTVKLKNGTEITSDVALRGNQCSMLVDSYLKQISDNHYAIEQPLQVMYTSFFYYLMQNAAVTELNDTSIALNGTTTTINLNGSTIALSKSAADLDDRLGNVKLKGDMQVRSIRVSIPKDSFKTSIAGCGLIFVLMLLVVFVPARRVEHFEEDASVAQQFVAMRSDEAYPDSVHKKTLLFPATSEVVAFDELKVERMVLAHESDRNKKVYL